ncbi:RNA polymerase sigma-70 factor [Arcticibacter eurypsychrophilus]|uniref:RNA polymerase sigma-70 factor n=1 Tax=Arcticibacter eurypsychrophilus TaxID=1434752 RepID=UPI00084D588C|nr:RNA polymerase sigma-70 factor [Arcticibacter eurypsychrophilus]
MNQYTDQELLNLLKEDHVPAFDELYDRYWSKLYSAAYKRIKSREDAEEIVQNIFTDIWTKRTVLHISTSFEHYLFTAVKYMVFATFKKENSRRSYENYIVQMNQNSDNSTEEVIASNELQQNLAKIVENLPERCKAVYEMSRKEHCSNKEISSSLGISEKTVENHLTRALKSLRIRLKETGTLFLFLF